MPRHASLAVAHLALLAACGDSTAPVIYRDTVAIVGDWSLVR